MTLIAPFEEKCLGACPSAAGVIPVGPQCGCCESATGTLDHGDADRQAGLLWDSGTIEQDVRPAGVFLVPTHRHSHRPNDAIARQAQERHWGSPARGLTAIDRLTGRWVDNCIVVEETGVAGSGRRSDLTGGGI